MKLAVEDRIFPPLLWRGITQELSFNDRDKPSFGPRDLWYGPHWHLNPFLCNFEELLGLFFGLIVTSVIAKSKYPC